MLWLYRFIFLPALLLALPYYLYRMGRRGGYAAGFSHRFGFFPRPAPPRDERPRIWIQAVSVGEVLAVGPLLEALRQKAPLDIVFTTTTSTGFAEARKRYGHLATAVGIFPIDFWLFSKLAWRRIRPDCLLLTESELWPEHLHQARLAKVPAFLINARMSETSFRRYRRVPALSRNLLGKFTRIFPATGQDTRRLLQLGADNDRLFSAGSIKFDVPLAPPLPADEREQLRKKLGFGTENGSTPVVLLGSSTWPGEEATLLRIQEKLRQQNTDCRLLLVPRHAERGNEIAALLEKSPLSHHRRSRHPEPAGPVAIHLADTTGELAALTQAADLAFIGKSLPPNKGGQTPIEAAGLGIPLLFGPRMDNFQRMAEALVREGAAEAVQTPGELEAGIRNLVHDPHKRTRMGQAGKAWHEKNRGSSQRIADTLWSDFQRPTPGFP